MVLLVKPHQEIAVPFQGGFIVVGRHPVHDSSLVDHVFRGKACGKPVRHPLIVKDETVSCLGIHVVSPIHALVWLVGLPLQHVPLRNPPETANREVPLVLVPRKTVEHGVFHNRAEPNLQGVPGLGVHAEEDSAGEETDQEERRRPPQRRVEIRMLRPAAEGPELPAEGRRGNIGDPGVKIRLQALHEGPAGVPGGYAQHFVRHRDLSFS